MPKKKIAKGYHETKISQCLCWSEWRRLPWRGRRSFRIGYLRWWLLGKNEKGVGV